MTVWTKVKKNTPAKGRRGRPSRTSPAVRRGKAGRLYLLLPKGFTAEAFSDAFSDGNGRVGFTFYAGGDYAIRPVTKNSKALRVTIPSMFKSRIPMGTTEVALEKDGNVTVLDLSQFEEVRA